MNPETFSLSQHILSLLLLVYDICPLFLVLRRIYFTENLKNQECMEMQNVIVQRVLNDVAQNLQLMVT